MTGESVTQARWEIIRRLFDAAVREEPAGRAEYLTRHCGADLSLRRELEALLAADREAGDGRRFRDAVLAVAWQLDAMRESDRNRRY